MITKHTFIMEDDFTNQLNDTPHSTRVEMNFHTNDLNRLVEEFHNYLLHCGYTGIDHVEVVQDVMTPEYRSTKR